MTGEGISDADALQAADVGLCMGTGCDVAKDSSDLIISDNQFESIRRSMLWGQATFNNVKKFAQFQLTVNIVICFITVLGGATLGRSPFSVLQMLWANLIMDVLGAIALGTEKYSSSSAFQRIGRGEPKMVVLDYSWRQILVQAIYQILVLVVLMYFGGMIFFEEPLNLVTAAKRDELLNPMPRLELDTIIFHTFILMSLFN